MKSQRHNGCEKSEIWRSYCELLEKKFKWSNNCLLVWGHNPIPVTNISGTMLSSLISNRKTLSVKVMKVYCCFWVNSHSADINNLNTSAVGEEIEMLQSSSLHRTCFRRNYHQSGSEPATAEASILQPVAYLSIHLQFPLK